MAARVRRHAVVIAAAAMLMGSTLSGCGMGSTAGVEVGTSLRCVDDSPQCLESRRVALEAIMTDKSKAWIRQSPDAAAYATGVRLFAFMKLKRSLSCDELAAGLSEARAARNVLRSASGQLTPGQISRGALLGDKVATHMRREIRRRRCRSAA